MPRPRIAVLVHRAAVPHHRRARVRHPGRHGHRRVLEAAHARPRADRHRVHRQEGVAGRRRAAGLRVEPRADRPGGHDVAAHHRLNHRHCADRGVFAAQSAAHALGDLDAHRRGLVHLRRFGHRGHRAGHQGRRSGSGARHIGGVPVQRAGGAHLPHPGRRYRFEQ